MQFRKAVIGRMRCIFWYSQMDRPEVCRLFREIYSLDGHVEVV